MGRELDIIIKMAKVNCQIGCFPTDFDENTNLMSVTRSRWKYYFVLVQVIYSAMYFTFALVQLIFALQTEGQLKFIIFHVIMILIKLLCVVMQGTSMRYTEDLIDIFKFVTSFGHFHGEFLMN